VFETGKDGKVGRGIAERGVPIQEVVMLVMDRAVDKEKPVRKDDDVRGAIESLKKSAPPSLTFTPEELDAYSDRLINIIDEYQI
jgi:hypothetical protein